MDIFKSYKKCSILGVYERKMRNIRKTNDAILEISATVEGEVLPETYTIHVNCFDYEKLKELQGKKRETLYLAYGMSDIDIRRVRGGYSISYSPCESICYTFYIKKSEFEEKVIDAFAPDEEKEY